MTFLQAGWLFGLLGMAVPIVLHLQKRRVKSMDWGAMKFLRKSLTQRRRGLTLEQLLLLLCRCLLLTAFFLAMARPWTEDPSSLPSSIIGSDTPRDVVLIIDGSDSMGLASDPDGKSNGVPLFKQAVLDAEQFLDKLPSQSTAAVLIADSHGSTEGVRLQSNLNSVRVQLNSRSLIGGQGDLANAIQRAQAVLKRGQNAHREIVVFTDDQRTNWQSLANGFGDVDTQVASANSESELERISILGRVRKLPETRSNLAVTKLTVDPSTIRAGQMARLQIEIFNGGSSLSEPTSLEVLSDGVLVETKVVPQLEPGLRQTISSELLFERAGTTRLGTRIDLPDDIPSDNVIELDVNVRPPVNVLIVNGDIANKPSLRGADFVRLALKGQVVMTELIEASQLDSDVDFDRFDTVILCDVPQLSASVAERLGGYVSNGGGLMLLLGSRCEPEFYNDWEWQSESLLPITIEELSAKREIHFEQEGNKKNGAQVSPGSVDVTSVQQYALKAWIQTGEHDLDEWTTNQFWRVQERPGLTTNVVVGLIGGEAFLVERNLGLGRILVQTIAPDPRENNFINRVSFPVWMHLLVQHLADGDRQLPLLCGHPIAEADLTPADSNQILAIAETIGIRLVDNEEQLLQIAAGLPVGIEWWRFMAYAVLYLVAIESILLMWVRCRRLENTRTCWRPLFSMSSTGWVMLPVLWLGAWLLWTYGWSIVGYATAAEFAQSGRLPGLLVATLSCLVAWTYWDSSTFLLPFKPTFAKSLRLILLGLLGFVILEPIRNHDEEIVEPRQVVVLWDRSDSMQIPFAESTGGPSASVEKPKPGDIEAESPSRNDIAQRLLWDGYRGQQPLLEELKQKYGVQVYEFAETARLIGLDRSAQSKSSFGSWAQTTDLSTALQRVQADIPVGELSGVIVLTDGCDHSDVHPTTMATPLAKQQIPIHSVIIGNQSSILDAEIATLQVPSQIYAGDEVTVRASVKAEQLSGQTAQLNFYRDGELLHARSVELSSNQVRMAVQFTDKPDEVGLHRYALEIEPLDGERILENNRREASVWVSNDRLRLLIVEQRPRWEFRYLKNLFAGRDRNVSLQHVLLSPDRLTGVPDPFPMAASAARAFDDCEANRLPESEQEWFKFDVIVLGDIDPSELNEATQKTLLKFVRQRGGTLIIIAGQNAMPHRYLESPLADLLPVQRFTQEAPLASSGYRIRLTADGLRSSLLQTPFADATEPSVWNSLPLLYWRHTASVAKPGATVLAWADEVTQPAPPLTSKTSNALEQNEKNALMLWHRYGGGRVLQLNFDQTWRLRFWNGDEQHHRFWGRVMRWGTEDRLGMGTDLVRLGIDRNSYNAGDTMTVKVRLIDDQLNPIENAAIQATLYRDNQSIQETILQELDDSGGLMQGKLTLPEIPGRYRIEIGGAEVERLLASENRTDKVVVTEFGVDGQLSSSEANDLVASAAVAIPLAEQTGGLVLVPETACQLLDHLGPESRYERERWSVPIWNTWPVVALFFLLINCEWIIRRRMGLI